jgi:hypothetical protein
MERKREMLRVGKKEKKKEKREAGWERIPKKGKVEKK